MTTYMTPPCFLQPGSYTLVLDGILFHLSVFFRAAHTLLRRMYLKIRSRVLGAGLPSPDSLCFLGVWAAVEGSRARIYGTRGVSRLRVFQPQGMETYLPAVEERVVRPGRTRSKERVLPLQ